MLSATAAAHLRRQCINVDDIEIVEEIYQENENSQKRKIDDRSPQDEEPQKRFYVSSQKQLLEQNKYFVLSTSDNKVSDAIPISF